MKIDVAHVAKLANLPLTEAEIPVFAQQLSNVLDYIEKLKEVDTEHVEPTSQVTGLENVTREDEVRSSLSQQEALFNAPNQKDGFFKVAQVLEE